MLGTEAAVWHSSCYWKKRCFDLLVWEALPRRIKVYFFHIISLHFSLVFLGRIAKSVDYSPKIWSVTNFPQFSRIFPWFQVENIEYSPNTHERASLYLQKATVSGCGWMPGGKWLLINTSGNSLWNMSGNLVYISFCCCIYVQLLSSTPLFNPFRTNKTHRSNQATKISC